VVATSELEPPDLAHGDTSHEHPIARHGIGVIPSRKSFVDDLSAEMKRTAW